ncbi:phosphoenolpyruvate carboxykinase (ATP) [Lujinxingia litoralis]|uniref:Phosphoenolpyruvate carboxykinase (ATP) n=1 Tax=Lujinxingia litoralis TaxID=2211119 RepID=A0A328C496_9DELT|nr:phosphoenolpyruvate carboxykinase (ATP) [Lujinxingia litoralis]RAL22141.1 phosphoenolpyruvate carboxykinase (ATP) [Lujinxingia litoralis]
MSKVDLKGYGIDGPQVLRNPSVARLYEMAIQNDPGAAIASSGALMAFSGEKTGRSPKDKRLVREATSQNDIWWGDVNIEMSPEEFAQNRKSAIEYLNDRPVLYVIDGYAGWDKEHQLKVRIVCARAYHALFMHNMLIRPSAEELESFGEPDYVIFNAGSSAADPARVKSVTSKTSVALNFERGEFVILGTDYAGEMKKGVFTIMHYLMPKRGVLSMHCSANQGNERGDVSLFFGLSGTGKTTLSTDPARALIGDDEHCWTDTGVFNIEGGCYAKTIDLSQEQEPIIYDAIRYGSVLENVGYDQETREVDYSDKSITENTRTSYPIEYVPGAQIPCVGGHPKNIIFLTCDAYGVLPPVSRLTPEAAMYHFISGYTAKVAGTEVGVTEPIATFSACFGAAFLVWHPMRYAELLAEKMRQHGANAWLVNTGWTGGAYGTGKRMKLKYTRAIIDAINTGALAEAPTVLDPYFKLDVVTQVEGVPSEVLVPKQTWADGEAFDATARKLVGLFETNFEQYADQAGEAILKAAPSLKG